MSNTVQNYKKIRIVKANMLRDMEDFYLQKVSETLSKSLNKLVVNIRVTHNILNIKTTPNNLKSVLFYLQNHSLFLFKQLQEITCIDRPEKALRFTVTYTLYSVKYSTNILVTVQLPMEEPLPSVTQIYEGADWLEREVWDLFGIFFTDHQDLRRILTDYGFQGHPLRKDFPLTGFTELYYNDSTKRLSYEPVELSQETRVWWVKQTNLI